MIEDTFFSDKIPFENTANLSCKSALVMGFVGSPNAASIMISLAPSRCSTLTIAGALAGNISSIFKFFLIFTFFVNLVIDGSPINFLSSGVSAWTPFKATAAKQKGIENCASTSLVGTRWLPKLTALSNVETSTALMSLAFIWCLHINVSNPSIAECIHRQQAYGLKKSPSIAWKL